MRKLYVWFQVLRFSLLWTRQLVLGDYITYRGERWIIRNGVSRPSWSIGKPDRSEWLEHVHQSEFRKERSIRNFVHDFRSGYRFYMGYWFDIWVRERERKYPRHMPLPEALR